MSKTKRTAIKKQRDRAALSKKKFLSLYADHKGNVSKLCAACHIGRATYYEWLKADVKFKAACDSAFEAIVDHVEDKLRQLIDAAEPSAIYFFLKCRAKNRGYVERQEVEHSGQVKTNDQLIVKVIYVKEGEGGNGNGDGKPEKK
jgi:hypothetical protein